MKKTDIFSQKKVLRKKIAEIKQSYSEKELQNLSEEVISTLELTEVFQKAKIVLAYYSLPDEVNTHELIRKYHLQKQILFGLHML